MEPEGSSPYSQVPATCPYPEPARSSPCSPSHFLKIHLNIILPSFVLWFWWYPHQLVVLVVSTSTGGFDGIHINWWFWWYPHQLVVLWCPHQLVVLMVSTSTGGFVVSTSTGGFDGIHINWWFWWYPHQLVVLVVPTSTGGFDGIHINWWFWWYPHQLVVLTCLSQLCTNPTLLRFVSFLH